jgi:hypothetical protein
VVVRSPFAFMLVALTAYVVASTVLLVLIVQTLGVHQPPRPVGELVPFAPTDLVPQRGDFSLDPDPFQVDHVAAWPRFECAHTSQQGVDVDG